MDGSDEGEPGVEGEDVEEVNAGGEGEGGAGAVGEGEEALAYQRDGFEPPGVVLVEVGEDELPQIVRQVLIP